jgi:hypothetical protein
MVWASRVVALAHLEERDTIYIFYGELSDREIEDERTHWNKIIEDLLPLRGYRVVIDRDATYEEWRDILLRRDAAGVIWRSHGNLGPSPYEPHDDHYMARVLARGGGRHKLFAGDWEAILPEGLAVLVLSSCMTNGIFLPEDFGLIEDRGNTRLATARISTFETEVGDRALHYRGYRGPAFSPGLARDDLLALRYFLPPRIDPAGGLPDGLSSIQERFVPGIEAGVVTVEWIPALIGLLSNGSPPATVNDALQLLSGELGRPLRSSDTSAWTAWWQSAEVQAAYEPYRLLAESRPPLDVVWVSLWSSFERERAARGGIPQDGPDCLLAWMHCLLDREELPEAVVNQRDRHLWQLVLPADIDEEHPCPVSQDVVVTFDPETRELTHNLDELLGSLDLNEVRCLSVY